MKRLMAIDYGDARTGIAISDLLCTLVGSTTVIHSRIPAQTAQEICRLAQENEVGEFIVGLPRNMDGGGAGASRGLRPAAGGAVRTARSPVG